MKKKDVGGGQDGAFVRWYRRPGWAGEKTIGDFRLTETSVQWSRLEHRDQGGVCTNTPLESSVKTRIA
jgi:hypothetical protein